MKPLFITILISISLHSIAQVNAGSGGLETSDKKEILFGAFSVFGSNRIFPKSDNGYSHTSYGTNYLNNRFNNYSGFGFYSRISGPTVYAEGDLECGILREDLHLSLYTYGYGNHGSCQDSYNDHFTLTQNIFETKISFLAGVKWFSQSERFNFETAIGFHLMLDHLTKTFINEESEINSGTCVLDTTYYIGPATAKVNTDYGMKPGFTFKAGFSYKCGENICIHFAGGARSADQVFYFVPYNSNSESPYTYKIELFSTLGCSYVINPMHR